MFSLDGHMKKIILSWILFTVLLVQCGATLSLDDFLSRKEVKEVRVLQNESLFDRILEVMIEQPVDHRNPEGPSFTQRLYISHVDLTKPVVLVTAGYDRYPSNRVR